MNAPAGRRGGLIGAVSLPDHLIGPVVVIVWGGALFALAAAGLAAPVALLERGEQPSGPWRRRRTKLTRR